MDLQNHLILIKGENCTEKIQSITTSGRTITIKFHKSDKSYIYSRENVVWLTYPSDVCFNNAYVFINGRREEHIKSIRLFSGNGINYYAVELDSGSVCQYPETKIQIRTSCLSNKSLSLFDYFKQCASINTLGTSNNSGQEQQGILSAIYSNIDFIDNESAAASYLFPERNLSIKSSGTTYFPFGCNASQLKAVKTALTSKISVIQGPPGTGKTQTILNIIANLLISGKTVLVVSNNNSATDNVLEKLKQNGLGFLAAPLGNKENKECFVANQPPVNPEISSWSRSFIDAQAIAQKVKNTLRRLESVFAVQEQLAIAKQELADLEVEKVHFEQENVINNHYSNVSSSTKRILKLLAFLNKYASGNHRDTGISARLKTNIEQIIMSLYLRYSLKIKTRLTQESVHEILSIVEFLYYNSKIAELQRRIRTLEEKLLTNDSAQLTSSLTSSSLDLLKARLSKRFSHPRNFIKNTSELYRNGNAILNDYPVVLSTTFSSRLCFSSETMFDYVIMDEASQVSVETGFLALTCARNAVIVGDRMQLPNVISDDDAAKLNDIKQQFNIPECYDATKHSFLSSIISALSNVPQTLLREHYRCHPDIINFCNQKFYGGDLLIMTKRQDGDAPLLAIMTSPGKHSRGHYNQREIDTVKLELLPQLTDKSDIGIITPYNRQVDEFKAQLPGIEVATVHRYQGREKDTIIMSVAEDEITEFTDNANLLNVAVSRAKNKFCLIVTGNPQELKGNIHDLIEYIKYRRGTVIRSKLHSIYDNLFTDISDSLNQNTVSEFQSENLTFDLIENIRMTIPQLSHIKVLCHYPLRSLIAETTNLSEREAGYAKHPATHIDFLVINRVTKEPLLAIETDGYTFHCKDSDQFERDRLKDHILQICGLPLLRLSTIGHSEKERIIEALLNPH